MNLLIVDDEPLIHVSIEISLKESADDLQVFHAYNGSEMLQKMEKQNIDIALVDIRMPGMDGLTAIDRAREVWPDIHYYIMSGFSEFEYAREAVRLGVAEYLLKPIEPEQLTSILAKVRQEKALEEAQLQESFHAWLAGTLHKHDVSSLYGQNYYSAVMLICCDSSREPRSDCIPEVLKNGQNVVTIPCREGLLILLYTKNREDLSALIKALQAQHYPSDTSCFVSPISKDPVMLANDMHRILDLSPIRVFTGIGQCRKLKQILPPPDEELTAEKEWILWRDLFLEERYADIVAKNSALVPSLSRLSDNQCAHLAAFLSVVTGKKPTPPYNAESLSSFLNTIGENVIHSEAGGDRIDAVILYVQQNFSEDISISKLSKQFDLSPNYISSLFKKKLGINFVDYLTSLRLGKAKALLRAGNLSSGEIAESVGYYSQSYFNKIFIKNEGCTPGEYRRKAGGAS